MTVAPNQARLTRKLSLDISETMAALWTRYAGLGPSSTYTEVQENEITISLVGVVANFERRTAADGGAANKALTLESYKREASATVGRLTHRHVLSMTTGHNRDSDVATEAFKLEAVADDAESPGGARRARLRKAARGAR
jgi:uncharacterized protein YbcI